MEKPELMTNILVIKYSDELQNKNPINSTNGYIDRVPGRGPTDNINIFLAIL